MHIRVAGAQMCVTNNIQANQEIILRAIDFSATVKADILLTPEGSLSGYRPYFEQAAVEKALQTVTDAARRARVGLALGTCYVEPSDGLCYDQLRFYAPDGTYLGFHTKILTCGTLTDPPEGEINDYCPGTAAHLPVWRHHRGWAGVQRYVGEPRFAPLCPTRI